MSDTTTAHERIREITYSLATGARLVLPNEVPEALDAYRAELVDEFIELLRQHRGDVNTDLSWWDTRDRDTAIRLLLNARTATAQEG